MAINKPLIKDVQFEETPERLKIILPLMRKWPYLILYSILGLLWMVMMIWGVIYFIQILFSRQSYRFLFAFMIVVLLLILYRFGKFLMRQWAHYLSSREVIFINREELIIRRPISIWGNTDVYDMAHISHLYNASKDEGLAFDYGFRHILIGEKLTPDERAELGEYLNGMYFPDYFPERN